MSSSSSLAPAAQTLSSTMVPPSAAATEAAATAAAAASSTANSPRPAPPHRDRRWEAARFLVSPPPPAEAQSWAATAATNDETGAARNYDSRSLPQNSSVAPAALIVLNQPICDIRYLERIWSSTVIHVCADGGANRLYDGLGDDGLRQTFLPDEILGDLDSLRLDVREFYEKQNVPVTRIRDQDSTDFGKCVRRIREIEAGSAAAAIPPSSVSSPTPTLAVHQSSRPGSLEPRLPPGTLHDLVVLGSLGGRFDHTMASIHSAFQIDSRRHVYLVSNDSIAMLLRPGSKHVIRCNLDVEGPTCGIIPFGCAVALVRTTGLKWNLDHSMPLSFGTLVSTSNAFADQLGTQKPRRMATVEVETNEPVVWTVECVLGPKPTIRPAF
ncbi:thiamine pyrophosphokinase [Zopfochytrium polystomum]|nr:thiamine pyrophosphokinase [Zopfochytrium polystomum]